MANRAIEAGRAFIELFLKDNTRRQFAAFERRTAQIGRGIASVGARLTAVGLAGGAALIPAVKAASDLEEQVSKFNVVFGQQSEAVRQFAQRFASDIGRSDRQIVEFLASFQDLFVPIGFDPVAAENLSKQLTGLTIDLASFNNKADADVLRDLQSALTGSGETVKKYGIILNEAGVKAELFNQGLDPTNASNQEKVLARLNIILAGSTAAQGDAARTAGSFANQLKRLQGNIEDVAGRVGQALLPSLANFAGILSNSLQSVGRLVSKNEELVRAFALTTAGVTAGGAALTLLGGTLTAVALAAGGIVSALTALATPLGGLAGAVSVAVSSFVDFEKQGRLLKDFLEGDLRKALDGIKDAFEFGDLEAAAEIAFLTVRIAIKRQLEGILADFEKFSLRLLSFGDDVTQTAEERRQGIEKLRQELAAQGSVPLGVPRRGGGGGDGGVGTILEEQLGLTDRDINALIRRRDELIENLARPLGPELPPAGPLPAQSRNLEDVFGALEQSTERLESFNSLISTAFDEPVGITAKALEELQGDAQSFEERFNPFARFEARKRELESFGDLISEFARTNALKEIDEEFQKAIGGEQLQKLEEARQKLKSLQEQEPETQRAQGTFFGSIAGRVFGTSRDPLEEQVKQQKLTVAELTKIHTATVDLARSGKVLKFGAG